MVMRATITTDINNYTVSQKREPLYSRPQLHEMLINFQNSFTGRFPSKFFRKSLLTKYPAIHLKHVATIPSAIIIDVQILDFLARQMQLPKVTSSNTYCVEPRTQRDAPRCCN